jgi:5-methylcytosine-specific restriction endonuclease McrA
MSSSVIVLNFDYNYLNTVSWQRAVTYVVTKRAEILKASEEVIRSANEAVKLRRPIVVRLLFLVKGMFKKTVPFTYKNVLFRDGHTCQYCGSKEDMTIDHVRPKSKGGKSTFENCVAACKPCNNYKGDRSLEELNMHLRREPYRPSIMEFIEKKYRKSGVFEVLKEVGVY